MIAARSLQTASRRISAVLGELDHVQQAELERPAPALEAEGAADRPAAPDQFVDQEALAVEPPEAGDLALGQIGEQRLVERPRVLAPPRGPGRPADDVVQHVRA